MGRSLKKGPYIDEKLLERVEELNRTGRRRSQDLVAALHDLPGVRRATRWPCTTARSSFPST